MIDIWYIHTTYLNKRTHLIHIEVWFIVDEERREKVILDY